jgi:putative restriction endonuclease
MKGYIGHTDPGWWQFLRDRPELHEVNFWRPSGRRFAALSEGEPFFFRLKSPVNKIGGFGLFSRFASLPVWRAWEVFGPANGVGNEALLVERLARLARRPVGLGDLIGCVAVNECVFFEPEACVDVPSNFNPQNLSGSLIDLEIEEGRRLWAECLDRASTTGPRFEWVADAADRERHGRPQIVVRRLGQGSFRLAVLDAYRGACAVTGEHALPALEAAHIRPWSSGGPHEVPNGIPLRRDLHRLFDLGYVSAKPDGEFIVSPRLREEFDNGHTYYALAGRPLIDPIDPALRPARELLDWHSEAVFMAS